MKIKYKLNEDEVRLIFDALLDKSVYDTEDHLPCEVLPVLLGRFRRGCEFFDQRIEIRTKWRSLFRHGKPKTKS